MEKIVALCRRRGFIFGSSEIYGGIGGFWDYGPLGCELKKNIKDAWWFDCVRNPPPGPGGIEYQMVGVECSIIMNPKVWEASGHVAGFADPMVACKTEGCKKLYRADKVFVVDLGLASPNGPEVSVGVEADSKEEAEARSISIAKRFRIRHAGDPDRIAYGILDEYAEIPTDMSRFLCPNCQERSLTPPRAFNLMFKTTVGALDLVHEIRSRLEKFELKTSARVLALLGDLEELANRLLESQIYLRPETAQGIFANFKNVMDSSRVKIPFGIAQIGKAFRNEINPRNYTFRSREFEQMEIEFFCHPDESRMWYEYWRDVRIKWYESLGIRSDRLRPREQGKDELAHYSCGTTDIEYLFPFSEEPQELEGVAHRGDFDLKAHGKHARNDEMAYAVIDEDQSRRREPSRGREPSRDREGADNQNREPERAAGEGKSKERYVPHVIEPSAGVDRFALAVICEAYSYDASRASPEFLKFHPRLAPIKAAVFPLVAKDGLPEIAEPIFREIKKLYPCQYDAKQSIGKRYARMDEAGTPFCFTIDGQTKQEGTVTVRDRDDTSQIRIDKSRCLEYLRDRLRL